MYRKDRGKEFYTTLAKKENYPARSVYKLKEMDRKHNLIKPGDRILDLGCFPGSWLLYLSSRVGDKGLVVGVDIERIKITKPANAIFIQKSVLDLSATDFKNKFEVVVSDLAPKTSGLKSLDSAKSLELAHKSFSLAKLVLVEGGYFVCKIFAGEGDDEFIKGLEKCFSFVKRFRPQAVIKTSKEFYVVAKGYSKINDSLV
jgi:23S rRNA (uridine2552-2'-O)-methyltransferase